MGWVLPVSQKFENNQNTATLPPTPKQTHRAAHITALRHTPGAFFRTRRGQFTFYFRPKIFKSLTPTHTPQPPQRMSRKQTQDVTVRGGSVKLVTQIGHGAFGDIYTAVEVATGRPLACKLELARAGKNMLQHEFDVYCTFPTPRPEPGLPVAEWFGLEGDYNVMIMELLGPNLQHLMQFCKGKFSLKTVLILAQQMIERLEQLHSLGWLHRDLKPQNFILGREGVSGNIVHLIDYGLAMRWCDPQTGKHIPFARDRGAVGTARYSSVGNQLGNEQSRRDDMESLGYVLIFMLKGDLPWSGISATTKQLKAVKVAERKVQTALEVLCEGLPPEFSTYLKYCKGLEFEQKPDYRYLRGLFRECFQREGFKLDYLFDWTLIKLKEHEEDLVERAARTSPAIDS